ncbi:hypothetical protein L873DRAFT_1209562 [Choiromyces venosus 120613-1]|uniref:Uncharacterized protein n=1 Tax=Choiromyces venosus 120613-1 TaxID=1336337 RepID=A0A3N4JEL6_9PEZI|nr:hypothetical protein L873DRAFT_1209562 [Choiromyces venosus 120613-1]
MRVGKRYSNWIPEVRLEKYFGVPKPRAAEIRCFWCKKLISPRLLRRCFIITENHSFFWKSPGGALFVSGISNQYCTRHERKKEGWVSITRDERGWGEWGFFWYGKLIATQCVDVCAPPYSPSGHTVSACRGPGRPKPGPAHEGPRARAKCQKSLLTCLYPNPLYI